MAQHCVRPRTRRFGNQRNLLSTAADLNETSLEQMLIDIAGLTDERGLKIAVRGMKLIIPKELQFIAERVMNSNLRARHG